MIVERFYLPLIDKPQPKPNGGVRNKRNVKHEFTYNVLIVIKWLGEHSHAPSAASIEATKVLYEVQLQAFVTHDAPMQIITTSVGNIIADGAALLPSLNAKASRALLQWLQLLRNCAQVILTQGYLKQCPHSLLYKRTPMLFI